MPQDVAFLPDGRILVADGLGNNRIMIFDNDMNYLGQFGEAGDGPGQFNTIHSLGIGPEGRIFVTDRSGFEVNLFRTTDDPAVMAFERSIGHPTGMPLDIVVNENDFWITALQPLRFLNFDFEGNLKYTWLVPRELPDGYLEVHTFTVDPAGNLIGGDNQYGRSQKFVPKPDADPELLIEPPWRAR
jgi:DNA-binding beta-propeller fold protein YncE